MLIKTFDYESNCVRYRDCYFDIGKYKNKEMSIDIYGYVEDDKNISHISNLTANVSEKLADNQVVIDNYNNTNIISFLLDLKIVKAIPKRVAVEKVGKMVLLPVAEIDLEILKEYSYDKEEELEYAS